VDPGAAAVDGKYHCQSYSRRKQKAVFGFASLQGLCIHLPYFMAACFFFRPDHYIPHSKQTIVNC